jgi:hypothetical protein
MLVVPNIKNVHKKQRIEVLYYRGLREMKKKDIYKSLVTVHGIRKEQFDISPNGATVLGRGRKPLIKIAVSLLVPKGRKFLAGGVNPR